MKKSRTFIFLFSLIAMNSAHAVSTAECSTFASEINKNFPARINSFITVTGTFCLPGNPKPTLAYRGEFDQRKSELLPNPMASIDKANQLNGWCTDPEQLPIFKMLDIKYIYYDRDGAYVGEVLHKIESCRL